MLDKDGVVHNINSNRRDAVYSLAMGSTPDLLPRRIVSLQPSATVMLKILGALDRLVACTKYCVDVCPEVAGQAIVADSWTAQSQQILRAKPDLVIASVPYQIEAVGEILKTGIPFLGLAPHSLEDIYKDFAMIARLIGEPRRGAEAISAMQQDIETVRGQSAGLRKRPKVYCEEWGKPMIRSQRWVAELVEAAAGEFMGEPGSHTDPSAMASADPDVIIMAWCGAGDRVPLAKVVEQRGWSDMRAVKAKRVYCLPDEFLNTPAPTLIEGLHALAGAIHPEVFSSHPRVKQL
jgi:iron complex transport system substrate-binding protein